jgi:hypothetical protein
LVNLKTKNAGDDYPRKAIEKPVLRFLGSRTFSHRLGREPPSENAGMFAEFERAIIQEHRGRHRQGAREGH